MRVVVQQQNSERLAEAAKLRARAERTRNHARALSDDPAAPSLKQYADELDASAEAVESATQDCEEQPDSDEGTR